MLTAKDILEYEQFHGSESAFDLFLLAGNDDIDASISEIRELEQHLIDNIGKGV